MCSFTQARISSNYCSLIFGMSPNWREISSESFFLQKQLETIDIFTSYKRLFNKSYGQSMYWTHQIVIPTKAADVM